jgi:hypothetical protein
LIATVLVGSCATACASSGTTPPTPRALSGHRILIGRLAVEGAPASEWVSGGSYSGAELIIDDHVTIQDGRPELQSTWIAAPGPPFTSIGAGGGPIHFGGSDDAMFILGLRVSRALVVLGTSSVFPILVRIPARTGPCDYIGTIRLRHEGDTTSATVVDDFDTDAPVLARSVGRCVPTRNLAQPLRVEKTPSPPGGVLRSRVDVKPIFDARFNGAFVPSTSGPNGPIGRTP